MNKEYWTNKIFETYIEGLDMTQFEHIGAVSSYNYNYYVGFGRDLLFALSDDDNITEWYLIRGNGQPIYLGISRLGVSSGDRLQHVSNT